ASVPRGAADRRRHGSRQPGVLLARAAEAVQPQRLSWYGHLVLAAGAVRGRARAPARAARSPAGRADRSLPRATSSVVRNQRDPLHAEFGAVVVVLCCGTLSSAAVRLFGRGCR